MNARFPMYEGDGFIRPGLSPATDADSKNANLSATPDFEALQHLTQEARRLRSEHVAQLIRSMIAWIADIPRRARQDRAERFLAGSTDHADVERRIRVLERSPTDSWNRRLAA